MLLVLTATAASSDAISYLGLGKVFPANMTGNTVLLGIGIAGNDYAGAGRSAVALGAFVFGALVAGLAQAGRARATVVATGVATELLALAAACAWWLAAGDHLGSGTEHGLIALVSAAMGIQSATIARLGVGVSTTYITGTWTSVSSWAASLLIGGRASRSPHQARAQTHVRQLLVLVVYFAAALGAGYAQHETGSAAIAIPFGLLASIALACALTSRPAPHAVPPQRSAR
jgi:uncharacterized membrane protein YoaK (UPF0700 family)